MEDSKKEAKSTEKSRPRNASEAFDFLLSSVGGGGKWQCQMVFLCSLCGVFISMPSMGAVFLAATPDHLCELPFVNVETSNSYSEEELRNFTTPWITSKDGDLKLSECLYYDRNYEEISIQSILAGNFSNDSRSAIDINGNNASNINDLGVKSCSRWSYDKSVFNSTVVTEFDLVCNEKWKKPTIQATYMLGLLIGGLFASAFSDRFGRRPTTLVSLVLFIISYIVTSFSNSYAMFIIFRFITGGSAIGLSLVTHVFMMELLGTQHRNLFGHLNGLAWIVGFFLLTLLAYFIRDWRSLQLTISVPCVILLCYFWFMPESPRWLLMQGRSNEGIELLKNIGKANGGKELPKKEEVDYALDIIKEEILKEKKEPTTSISKKVARFGENVFSLVRTPNMRRRNLIMFYNWFVVSMCYYGISFSGENIGASLYTLGMIGALLEFPGTFYCYYTAVRFGRRTTLCSSMTLAGICCIAILLVPIHIAWLNVVLVLLGRMFLGSAFISVFFFSIELVPTNIRNIAIGMASTHAKFGSIIAPYIVDLMGQIYYAIPSTIFGVLSLLAGALALLLPETSEFGLPESIEEIELLSK